MEARKAVPYGFRKLTRNHLARKLLRVDFRFRRLKHLVDFVLEPKLYWRFIETVIQAPTCGQTDRTVEKASYRMFLLDADGNTIKGDAQILSHPLYALMLCALKPGKNGIARKEIGPSFKRLGNVNAQLKRFLHHRRTGIRRENVSPKFSVRVTAADIHDERD